MPIDKQINEQDGKRSDNYSREDFDHTDQIQQGQDVDHDRASLAATHDQHAKGPHAGVPHDPAEFDTQNPAKAIEPEHSGHPIGSSGGIQNTKADELKRKQGQR